MKMDLAVTADLGWSIAEGIMFCWDNVVVPIPNAEYRMYCTSLDFLLHQTVTHFSLFFELHYCNEEVEDVPLYHDDSIDNDFNSQ